jgi:uroporphyrinogen-III synthase
VYQWTTAGKTPPPLREAVTALARGEIDIVVLTSSVQLAHVVADREEQHLGPEVRRALEHTVIASIGPTTSEEGAPARLARSTSKRRIPRWAFS